MGMIMHTCNSMLLSNQPPPPPPVSFPGSTPYPGTMCSFTRGAHLLQLWSIYIIIIMQTCDHQRGLYNSTPFELSALRELILHTSPTYFYFSILLHTSPTSPTSPYFILLHTYLYHSILLHTSPYTSKLSYLLHTSYFSIPHT